MVHVWVVVQTMPTSRVVVVRKVLGQSCELVVEPMRESPQRESCSVTLLLHVQGVSMYIGTYLHIRVGLHDSRAGCVSIVAVHGIIVVLIVSTIELLMQ